MTPTDITFALGVVDITEGNTPLTDLAYQNISSILPNLPNSNKADFVHNIIRIYIWAWLMVGYELGFVSNSTHAYKVSEKDLLSAYTAVFRRLDKFDESLLLPIQERLNKIDVIHANEGFGSLCKNMIAVMSTWMCEVGMVIARKPNILRTELHYIK